VRVGGELGEIGAEEVNLHAEVDALNGEGREDRQPGDAAPTASGN
jgi:hypothetical protein